MDSQHNNVLTPETARDKIKELTELNEKGSKEYTELRHNYATVCAALKTAQEDKERVLELETALKPFAHPDLSEKLTGNIQGDDSPVFGRNRALLTLGHFRAAHDVIKTGYPAARRTATTEEGKP